MQKLDGNRRKHSWWVSKFIEQDICEAIVLTSEGTAMGGEDYEEDEDGIDKYVSVRSLRKFAKP